MVSGAIKAQKDGTCSQLYMEFKTFKTIEAENRMVVTKASEFNDQQIQNLRKEKPVFLCV